MAEYLNQAIAAASENRAQELGRLIERHPELLDARDPDDGGTLLHVAAWGNALDCCKLLVDRGADPSAIREKKFQAEHRHAGCGSQTPLALALEGNKADIVAYLRTIRITPDNLWMAASLGDLERVDRFFNADGSLTTNAVDPGKCGTSQDALDDALVGAAHQQHNDMVIYLMDRGANPSGRDQFGMTALHYAVQDNLPLVKVLVARGADPKVRDFQFNATPVGWARYLGHADTLAYLLELADIDPDDREVADISP